MAEGVRLDKWLMVTRVFKTRALARRACDLGRVEVNGLVAKAHKTLALEDRVEVVFGDWRRILVVKELRDKPVRKADAPGLYDDQSPPRPRLSELERLLRRAPVLRERGRGRPEKKERRQLERLRRRERLDD